MRAQAVEAASAGPIAEEAAARTGRRHGTKRGDRAGRCQADSDARHVGPDRRHALRAGGAGADRRRPARRLREIEALLAQNAPELRLRAAGLRRRCLAARPGEPTIGGVVACNWPGRAGSRPARRATTSWASGGQRARRGFQGRRQGGEERHRLRSVEAAGRLYGTLAVLTEVTLKVLPAPADTRTVLIRGLDDATAIG